MGQKFKNLLLACLSEKMFQRSTSRSPNSKFVTPHLFTFLLLFCFTTDDMNIMEALQWANNKLKKSKIDSAMLDAEILLSHVLDVPKPWLFAHFTDNLKQHHEEKFSLLIDRRIKHEPVAYLTGVKEFYGHNYIVNPSVLIPRPATETMVDETLTIFSQCDPNLTLIVDIGTGSGVIAITLAKQTHTSVLATDVESNALAVAKENAKRLDVNELIEFQQGNLLEPTIKLFHTLHSSKNPNVSSVYPFRDLIICANLPYLTLSQIDMLDHDVRFEPITALKAGVDGLDAYFELLKQLKKNRGVLPRRIHLLIEVDPKQVPQATHLILHQFPEANLRIVNDLQGLERVIVIQI